MQLADEKILELAGRMDSLLSFARALLAEAAPDDDGITEFGLRSACEHLGALVDQHREVLIEARAIIQRDRDSLYETCVNPVTEKLDAADQKGVDEYDAVLMQIDALLPDGVKEDGRG